MSPKNDNPLKRKARKLQKETGITYTEALRQVTAQDARTPRPDPGDQTR